MQTWHLLSNNEDSFTLSFEIFDVQHGWEDDDNNDGFPDCWRDYVYISGGTTSSPQPLDKKYCNQEEGTPGPNPGPFTGTDITVKFKSNFIGTRSGFLAAVTGDVTVTTDVTGQSGNISYIIK